MPCHSSVLKASNKGRGKSTGTNLPAELAIGSFPAVSEKAKWNDCGRRPAGWSSYRVSSAKCESPAPTSLKRHPRKWEASLPGETLTLRLVATSKSVHRSSDPQDLFTALQKRVCTHGRILTVVKGTSCGVQKEQGGAKTAMQETSSPVQSPSSLCLHV